MQIAFSIQDLIDIVAPTRVEGTSTDTIEGIASLEQAQPGDLSFLGNPKYRAAVSATRATAVLVPEDYAGSPREGQVFLRVGNPSIALARICRRLEAALWPRPGPGVHPSAVVDPAAILAPGVTVGPLCVVEAGASIGQRSWLEAGVFVGRGARIGADCRLFPGVKLLAECELRDRVVLHPGVVIGGDGFGYETTAGRHEKVPQVGNVIVHDDVEVGSNSTIDRARFDSTIIGEGTKIDNLVQIGHNVLVGRHCILCALVGIAGTVTLGDYVVMGGQAGAAGHLTIGTGAMVGGRGGVTNDIEPGARVWGTPAHAIQAENRIVALRRRLPEFFKRLEAVEAALGLPRPPRAPADRARTDRGD